jgi:hypothetical protein
MRGHSPRRWTLTSDTSAESYDSAPVASPSLIALAMGRALCVVLTEWKGWCGTTTGTGGEADDNTLEELKRNRVPTKLTFGVTSRREVRGVPGSRSRGPSSIWDGTAGPVPARPDHSRKPNAFPLNT